MKQKLAAIISLIALSFIMTLASCAPITDGAAEDSSQITIKLPPIASYSIRALNEEQVSRLQRETAKYRVTFSGAGQTITREGDDTTFSAIFPTGTQVGVTVYCLNRKGEVIVRSVEKTITMKSGTNSVSFKLSEDGKEIEMDQEDPPSNPDGTPSGGDTPKPEPPAPEKEYVNITFNQGFVYTNTVHQSPNTWQDMTGAALPNSGQREKGSPVSADQATATDYVFKGWVESNVQPSGDAPDAQNFDYVQNYNSNMTLYAIWEQIEPGSHSVKFAGGTTTGSSVSGLPQGFQQKEGILATFSGTPTCPGYEFAGWSANVSGVNATQQGSDWTFTMPTSDVTFTAQWNVITYTVSYEANDGQATPSQTETFTVDAGGANVTLKAANTFTRTGYTLSSWSAGGSNIYNPSASIAKTSLVALATGSGTNRTITLTAQWTINTYKITYSNTNGGTGSADTANATTSFNIETQSITLAAAGTLAKGGGQFAGWETTDGTNTDVSNMNAAQLIALITSGDTLALQVKWQEGKRTVLYSDGKFIINELPENRRNNVGVIQEYAAMKDDGSNYKFNGLNKALWYDYRDSITSVEIGSDITPTSTSNWFYEMSNCTSIINLTKLDTSNVTNMSDMFYKCSGLISLDVSNFDTSNVTNMGSMFYKCSGLISLDVSNFDTSNVTSMSFMFYYCSGLTSLDVSNFDTSKVTTMSNMFTVCSGLTTLNVSNFDTSKVTNMSSMFERCSKLTSLDVSKFNTSKVTTMYYMFDSCSKLTSLDVSKFDTSNVTDMSHMFYACSGVTSLDVSNFNTSKVTTMSNMFYNCSGLTTLDVSNFDTSNVTTMERMFRSCSGLTSLDVSSFDTSNVTSMGNMFSGCSGLTSLDLSNFDTSKVTGMGSMFYQCSGLTSLDLSNFDTSNVTSMYQMFYNCSKLETIYASISFVTSSVTSDSDMFKNCSVLRGGQGTQYSSSNVNTTYARIDDLANGNPGYFTAKP